MLNFIKGMYVENDKNVHWFPTLVLGMAYSNIIFYLRLFQMIWVCQILFAWKIRINNFQWPRIAFTFLELLVRSSNNLLSSYTSDKYEFFSSIDLALSRTSHPC